MVGTHFEEGVRVPDDVVGWLFGPPGVGFNCVLVGHRDVKGSVFKRLDELERCNRISVQDRDGEWHTYITTEKLVVGPDDVSVLEGEGDKRLVTLVTCTPPGIGTHRLVIRGELERR